MRLKKGSGKIMFWKSGIFSNAYLKLFLSYLTITCTIVLLLGIAFYSFFSSRYNQKVIEVNNKVIEQEKNIIEDTYIKKVSTIYIGLASENINSSFGDFKYFFTNPVDGNYVRLYNDYSYLENIVQNNSDIIDAIHLYLPFNRLLISTTWGVKYLSNDSMSKTDTIGWFQYAANPPQNGLWLDTRPMQNAYYWSNLDNGITYIRSFPLFANSVPRPGLIAFDLNEAHFKNVLSQSNTAGDEISFIINRKGTVISSSDSSLLYSKPRSSPYILHILDSDSGMGNFTMMVGRQNYMISFMTMDSSDWKIVSMTPISEYYRQTAVMNQIVFGFCAAAFLLGLVLTYVFSKKMYHPLQSLLAHIRDLFDEKEKPAAVFGAQNEYLVINDALGRLSDKIEKQARTIVEYKPLVKQNMILFLFNNAIPKCEDFDDLRKICGISFSHPGYCCLLLRLEKPEIEALDLKGNLYATYLTISCIEAMTNPDVSLNAVMLSQSDIGVIVNAESSNALVFDLVEKLLLDMISKYDIGFTGSLGLWTDDPLTLFESYREAQAAMKYKFYFPDEALLFYENFSSLKDNAESQKELTAEKFMDALNSRSMENVAAYLDSFCKQLASGGYTFEFCERKLAALVDAFIKFCGVHDLNAQMSGNMMRQEFSGLADIHAYHDCFIRYIRRAFCLLEEKRSVKNQELIEKAKVYIAEHLGNQLSLDSVAQYVQFTPKYFSKLFKEIAGINFQEYVTEQRLKKAKNLLSGTERTVEQISAEIGYCSPAYFIKQFKKAFGYTPYCYRTDGRKGTI